MYQAPRCYKTRLSRTGFLFSITLIPGNAKTDIERIEKQTKVKKATH